MDGVCWDNEKHDIDEEAGWGGTLRRAGGRSRVRGQGKGAGFDRFSQVEHTKTVLEIALDEEIADHLGHAKCEKTKAYRAANACNGTAADRWPSEGAQQQ